ncbi:hypothetical protein GUF49_04755, partial [Xanthomonas citri pv. citri]|nr:hypothetical protein [Xanthomonas citri pv. citri]
MSKALLRHGSSSSLSLTGEDLVQQALMNGDITVDEAKVLRWKNQQVSERMAALEAAYMQQH